MDNALGGLTALLLLGFLVVVHELGHLVVARLSGVRILCFSVGFGPKLLKWTRGHTEYVLSAIPLGGYVKMAGEQRAEATSKPWEYLSKPVGTRARIVFAGPFVNYLVAFLSLWVVFMLGFPEMLPVVGTVAEEMPAHAAGLQVGDQIQSINDQEIRTWEEMTKVIYAAAGQRLELGVARDGARKTITVTPTSKEMPDPFGGTKTVGLIGISPSGEFESSPVGPLAALGKAAHQQYEWTWQTLAAVRSMILGRLALRDSVAGPIALVVMTSEAVKMGLPATLIIISLLSLSLAIFNVFPIPILDGGHLLFLGLEKLRGRPVSMAIQERAVQVSFVLLMGLILTICVFDISRLGWVEKLGTFFGF